MERSHPYYDTPREHFHPMIGLVVMIGGIGLACLLPWPWAVRVLGVSLLALTVRFVLGGVFGWPESHPWAGWDTSQSSMHWGVGAGIWILSWLLTERHHEDRRSSLHWFVLSGMAGTAAFVLMQGGVASLAQLSGAVAVGMLILAFAAMARRDLGIDPGTALIASRAV